ncbi:MAG TPA: hypothetical protein VFK20_05665 [Vicinamibacterales bacterium]|nr:hypothetical protein [Vicinamibacterales bacterium]
MRAALESLLRARKLDVTLTPAGTTAPPPDQVAATGCPVVDAALRGGLRRGHLSEIVGPPSSGRTSLMTSALAAATARGELAALVDAGDTFDPPSAAAAGLVLPHLLWVREPIDAARALKAFSLILQAGGFGLVVLDVADVPDAVLRRFPWSRSTSTWMRLARMIEGSDTVALLVGRDRLARSPGGVTIALDAASPRGRWSGASVRARLFRGVDRAPRIVRAHAG